MGNAVERERQLDLERKGPALPPFWSTSSPSAPLDLVGEISGATLPVAIYRVKRCCAACLLTPSAAPMIVHESPASRADCTATRS